MILLPFLKHIKIAKNHFTVGFQIDGMPPTAKAKQKSTEKHSLKHGLFIAFPPAFRVKASIASSQACLVIKAHEKHQTAVRKDASGRNL